MTTNTGIGMGKGEYLHTVSESLTFVATLKSSLKVSHEARNRIPIWHVHATPGLILKGYISFYRGPCSFMFIDAIFTIARKWEQPRPSMIAHTHTQWHFIWM